MLCSGRCMPQHELKQEVQTCESCITMWPGRCMLSSTICCLPATTFTGCDGLQSSQKHCRQSASISPTSCGSSCLSCNIEHMIQCARGTPQGWPSGPNWGQTGALRGLLIVGWAVLEFDAVLHTGRLSASAPQKLTDMPSTSSSFSA